MPFPAEIAALVETFAAHEDDYTSPEFKEAQVRQQFLDPLFAALGWDVANTAGYAEAYKEVIHEDALKIGGETKAPDYSFRIGGQRKFFVEAKKPSVLIKDHPEPAYQLRRYSWSAKLPLGILTDFQEFAVYDTRVKPSPSDKASAARLFYCRYDELAKNWDFIAGTFSKEAVLKGSFDKYAATTKGKRGTATVDDAFLEEIESWRDLLARNLALRNPALDVRGLNFAVQRIIDRIVFLRIAEDRGNEPFGQLQALTAGPKLYPRLVEIFEKADYRYNSGLFHFAKDADCAETPDTLTPGLTVDDAVLREIIGSLYYPRSPYAFGVLPAYILGHVYEQFLGKVIRLTDGHQARVEEKPEVRKAGGVYYTPQYIVDYIVQKTLDPLLDGKTPKQVETLAVLDPACGSGTFLLGAYEHLLKWYLAHYSANAPEKWAKQGRVYEAAPHAHLVSRSGTAEPFRSPPASAPSWQLTTAERKRILLAHVHGVDIDAAAVEVTKLSLLLKVLEGERREFQGKTKEMSAVLPDLSQNIRCGNSLIGHDFYSQPDLPVLDAEAKYKLNTFEWKDGFPEVMKRGGFDAVIGNPPYGADLGPEAERYLRANYASLANSADSFIVFMEQAGRLLKRAGQLGVIIPSGWVSTPSTAKLRKQFRAQFRPETIVSLPYDVFSGAYIDTMVVTASRLAKTETWESLADRSVELVVFPIRHKIQSVGDFASHRKTGDFSEWKDDFLVISSREENKLIGKLRSSPKRLENYADVMRGIETYDPRPKAKCISPKRAFTGDVLRYSLEHGDDAYEDYSGEIAASKPLRFFKGPRLLLRQLLSRKFRLQAVFADEEFLTNQSMQSLVANTDVDIRAVLAILNSRIVSWYFCQVNTVARRDDFPKTIIKQTRDLPFPTLKAKSVQHDKAVNLIDEMLALHRDQAAAQSPHEKDALAKQITATDRQIDALVYQLYGLTPDEIALVEGGDS